MTTNIAGVRVDEGSFDGEFITLQVPRCFAVHIPVIDETRHYDLGEVDSDKLLAKLEYGISKVLTDAGAGLASDRPAALKKVADKEKRLFSEGRGSADPVTSEMFRLAVLILKAGGAKTKEVPQSLKAFPAWLDEQDEDEVAKLRQVATVNVEAKKAELAKIAALGIELSK